MSDYHKQMDLFDRYISLLYIVITKYPRLDTLFKRIILLPGIKVQEPDVTGSRDTGL